MILKPRSLHHSFCLIFSLLKKTKSHLRYLSNDGYAIKTNFCQTLCCPIAFTSGAISLTFVSKDIKNSICLWTAPVSVSTIWLNENNNSTPKLISRQRRDLPKRLSKLQQTILASDSPDHGLRITGKFWLDNSTLIVRPWLLTELEYCWQI